MDDVPILFTTAVRKILIEVPDFSGTWMYANDQKSKKPLNLYVFTNGTRCEYVAKSELNVVNPSLHLWKDFELHRVYVNFPGLFAEMTDLNPAIMKILKLFILKSERHVNVWCLSPYPCDQVHQLLDAVPRFGQFSTFHGVKLPTELVKLMTEAMNTGRVQRILAGTVDLTQKHLSIFKNFLEMANSREIRFTVNPGSEVSYEEAVQWTKSLPHCKRLSVTFRNPEAF
ncbi:hypothetical protein L596_023118 [Steinernema carpocapsae]|uniref:Uncharacterized protein n=1 Tax=Steinernema carpocapsae TaxID=34508 RepID=A0A4U5MCP9_STECR|nr:hypothetical protein L596_023118 [Steinernema carpocapsae]